MENENYSLNMLLKEASIDIEVGELTLNQLEEKVDLYFNLVEAAYENFKEWDTQCSAEESEDTLGDKIDEVLGTAMTFLYMVSQANLAMRCAKDNKVTSLEYTPNSAPSWSERLAELEEKWRETFYEEITWTISPDGYGNDKVFNDLPDRIPIPPIAMMVHAATDYSEENKLEQMSKNLDNPSKTSMFI